MSTRHIRRSLAVLQEEMGVAHALASARLFTDGARILFDYTSAEGDDEVLTVVLTKQRVFQPVIEHYLTRISFADDGLARRLILPFTRRDIAEVDPARAFGQPILLRGGARVQDLVGRYRAGDSIEDIAADFNADPQDVDDVTRAATYFPAA